MDLECVINEIRAFSAAFVSFSLLRGSSDCPKLKTPSFAIEKTLSSIYLDPSQTANFGGLDAVY